MRNSSTLSLKTQIPESVFKSYTVDILIYKFEALGCKWVSLKKNQISVFFIPLMTPAHFNLSLIPRGPHFLSMKLTLLKITRGMSQGGSRQCKTWNHLLTGCDNAS